MDISFKTESGKLNYRITSVIFNSKNNKFLLQKGNGFDFWVLPGGRCQMGELSSQAVIREAQEELGDVNIVDCKAIAVSENLFDYDDCLYHELSFCYKLDIDESDGIFLHDKEFYGPESEDYFFKWMSIEEIEQVKIEPSFVLSILKNVLNGNTDLKHYTLNEL